MPAYAARLKRLMIIRKELPYMEFFLLLHNRFSRFMEEKTYNSAKQLQNRIRRRKHMHAKLRAFFVICFSSAIILCCTGPLFPEASIKQSPDTLFAGMIGDCLAPFELAQGAVRMSRSTCADSYYQFNIVEAGTQTSIPCMLRYRQTWSDLPDTLTPGRPFNIKLAVDVTEHRIPSDAVIIDELKMTTGVIVTAGREWITRILTTQNPERMKNGTYYCFDPSPQLYLNKDISAGLMSGRWVGSQSGVFNDPVPGIIPDSKTFALPKENIKDEMMLVIFYAIGFNGRVYVDSNYVYLFSNGVWKLRSQFNTAYPSFVDTRNNGKMFIELVE